MRYKLLSKKPGSIAVFMIGILVITFFIGYSLSNSKPTVGLFVSCSLDNVMGATKVNGIWVSKTGTSLTAQGWAADSVMSTPPNQVIIELVDKKDRVVKSWQGGFGTARPDVVHAYSNPSMGNSGFGIQLGSFKNSGNYQLIIGDVNSGQRQLCETPNKLKINP